MNRAVGGNQELARELDLALLELGRLTDQVVIGGGEDDITSEEAVTFIPEDDTLVAADDAAIVETEKRKKVIRNVAIGTAAPLARRCCFYILRK